MAVHRIVPDIIVSLRICPALPGLDKPCMLIRCVVHDKIHDNPDAARMRFGQETVEILHRAEFRINGAVVTDVVSIVRFRALIDRREPDDINAEFLQIVQFSRDPGKIADAVAVAVGK